MQKISTLSQPVSFRLIVASIVIAVLSQGMLWVVMGREAPFYISSGPYPSLATMLLVTFLPYLICLGVIGGVSYLLLRRKIAIFAGVASGIVISALSHIISLTSGRSMMLVTSLVALLGPILFSTFYIMLSKTRRPRVMSVVLIAITGVLWIIIPMVVLYIIRSSYTV